MRATLLTGVALTNPILPDSGLRRADLIGSAPSPSNYVLPFKRDHHESKNKGVGSRADVPNEVGEDDHRVQRVLDEVMPRRSHTITAKDPGWLQNHQKRQRCPHKAACLSTEWLEVANV